MLVISSEQMKAMERVSTKQFAEEMIVHSRAFSPRLCEILGDEQLRIAVFSAIDRARAYEFTNRGPIRLFIEMMFLCGSAFDTDPQYRVIGRNLRASDDQMQRAGRIRDAHLDYLEKVSGPGAVNVHRALRDLADYARISARVTADDFVPGMLQEMNRLFPEKVAYVGAEPLTSLIHEGRKQARGFGFQSERGEALIVILMFAFGHGCTDDPLYPWISNTLRDERIRDSEARLDRLEKKALTWLEHVNARNEERHGRG